MPTVSVVIPTRRSEAAIECLSQLHASPIDNVEVVVRHDDGIARARNEGIRRARADKIVFLDDDAVPRDGYLQHAVATLEDHPVVAGRVHDAGDERIGQFATHYDQGAHPGSARTIVGCNMAFRREVFESVGYFDEAIAWGHDESELKHRIRESFDIYYEPKMAVDHPYAASMFDYWRKMYRLGRADPYYWKQQGKAVTTELLLRLASPFGIYHGLESATIIKAGGRLAKKLGMLRGYVSQP